MHAGITTLGNQAQKQRGSHSLTTRRARAKVKPPRVLASSPQKGRTRVKARVRKETTRAPRVALELRQQWLRQHRPAQKAWQSFCQFCDKALPSLNMFLKLSVPILATLISSITNSNEQIGEQTAASIVHPAVQNFKKYSLEFWGDTGAAHDIGSLTGRYRTKDLAGIWWSHG